MSAINFLLAINKVEDPKGDQVGVVMCGKVSPAKKRHYAVTNQSRNNSDSILAKPAIP